MKRILFCASALLLGANAANAATATGAFNVTLTLNAQCTVSNANNLTFGTVGLLSGPVNQTSTFQVTCTNATPYTVGLNAGQYPSGAQRQMLNASTTQYVAYNLYQDSAYSTPWGNASGVWESGTGTGAAQSFTVYGQVPAQTTPPPGTYSDTVTITVTY